MSVVSLRELLENPKKYNGKVVETFGLYINRLEHRAIHDPENVRKLETAIWLRTEVPAAGGEVKAKSLNHKIVRVIGVFWNRSRGGAGHLNQCLAELKNITKFEVLDPTVDA